MIPIGTKVQIAATLDAIPGWRGRKPGARGAVVAHEDRSDGTIYSVYHDDGSATARYLRDELTPVRERATEAAAPSPERARLAAIEQELRETNERHRGLREAMASELAGLCARIGELEREQDSGRICRRAADKLETEAAVAAAQTWCEVADGERQGVLEGLRDASCWRWEHTADAAAALDAVPELLRLVDLLTAQRDELLRRDDDWRRRCEGGAELYRRVCQALHVDEDSMPVGQLADLVMARCQLYDRLSDPDAYDEPDPDKLAAAALIAAEREAKQAWVLADLRDVFGDEAGHGLRECAARAVLHAAPVLRLLEAHSGAELRRLANGLKWWAAEAPAHSVTRAAAEHFAELANLADRDPDGDQS